MYKRATSILIAIVLLGGLHVHASEVTGNISTDSSGNTNTTNPTPTPTPTPDSDPGHSSEVTGELASNTVGTQSPGGLSGEVVGGSNQSIYYGVAYVDTSYVNPPPQDTATTTATSTDESSSFALLDFGPRYGTPGPPFAGGSSSGGAGYESLTVASNEPLETVAEMIDLPGDVAFVPRSGEGPVTPDQLLGAQALVSGQGYTMAQLLMIALVGLVILGSMGYAISRAGPGKTL